MKTSHETQEQMAKDLIELLNFGSREIVLDAGSGKNKVWFNNLPTENKFECEIENGCDFYKWNGGVEWVIGNPPYHESWKFTEKAISVASKGVAWLLNNQAMNSHFTPARLTMLYEKGWHYTRIHIVADKRWFGRYYFLVLEKRDVPCIISWNKKTY